MTGELILFENIPARVLNLKVSVVVAPLCPLVASVVLPDRDEQDHQKGEDHLHVGQRIHPEGTQDDELDHLQPGEEVDLPLRHAANVVGGRIGSLGRDGESVKLK